MHHLVVKINFTTNVIVIGGKQYTEKRKAYTQYIFLSIVFKSTCITGKMSLFIRTKLKNVFRSIELSNEEVENKETLIDTIISKGNRKKIYL